MDARIHVGNRHRLSRAALLLGAALLGGLLGLVPVRADTVVLKDGTIIEGKVVSKSTKYVRINTRYGRKSIRRKDIERITEESVEESALHAMGSTPDFDALSPEARTLKNAQALYDLGRFAEIPPLVEPLIGKGSKYDDMRIRWLLIDNHIRQAQWAEAEKQLKTTLEDGREPDKIRAQVYLDIFKQNPGYNLRKIGEVRSREFLDWDTYLEAKQVNSLQNPKIMSAAVRQVLDQTLRDEKVSIYALKETMSLEETLGVILRELQDESNRGKAISFVKLLPYVDKMKAVERSLYRADAIMPGAARGFQLDLVRTETGHLRDVIIELLTRLSDAYPGTKTVATDEHGRLTKEGREQWRDLSDDFLEICRPVLELIDYLLERARAFPTELEPFIKEWEDTKERVNQMRQNTVRNRDRTR